MEIRQNGARFSNYRHWESIPRKEYDYANDGFLRNLISPAIMNTSNTHLKSLLQYIESSFVFALKYIDILKNFKNIHWRNR